MFHVFLEVSPACREAAAQLVAGKPFDNRRTCKPHDLADV